MVQHSYHLSLHVCMCIYIYIYVSPVPYHTLQLTDRVSLNITFTSK